MDFEIVAVRNEIKKSLKTTNKKFRALSRVISHADFRVTSLNYKSHTDFCDTLSDMLSEKLLRELDI
jgi:hypothetical protein